MSYHRDTIAAPLTGSGLTLGASAISVVRVSGPDAVPSLKKLAKRAERAISSPRELVLSEIRDGDEVLDTALVCFFAAPKSFTGEEVVEYYLSLIHI